jgi:alpha-glucosidase
MNINRILFALRSIGFSGIYRTLFHTVLSNTINKSFLVKSTKDDSIFPGNITRFTQIDGGVEVDYDYSSLEVLFLSENITRISWKPGDQPYPYTVIPFTWDHQQPSITPNENGLSVACKYLSVDITKTGNINFLDKNQKIIHADDPPVRIGNKWKMSSLLKQDEHIYGLGERAGRLNLRPGTYCSWNSDVGGRYSSGTDPLYIGTPIYLSLSHDFSYLLYFENSYSSTHTIGDKFTSIFDGGMLRYYLLIGPIN